MFLMMSIQTRFSFLFFNSTKENAPFLFSLWIDMLYIYVYVCLESCCHDLICICTKYLQISFVMNVYE